MENEVLDKLYNDVQLAKKNIRENEESHEMRVKKLQAVCYQGLIPKPIKKVGFFHSTFFCPKCSSELAKEHHREMYNDWLYLKCPKCDYEYAYYPIDMSIWD